ncbi:MAG: hypothetical protein JNM72_25340 [Deltaproteobacteria bacterium]|nr:hypothetical protein [Deltaproteobacteria bacterium]
MRAAPLLTLCAAVACAKQPPPSLRGAAHAELLESGAVRRVEGPTPDTPTRLQVCPALQALRIEGLQLDDADGDGHWRVGERLLVGAAVVNTGAALVLDPALTADGLPPGFGQPAPSAAVHALEPGAPALLHTWIDAPDLPQVVELALRLTDGRGAACPGVAGAVLRLAVE